jgi:hypothetical protein
MSVLGLCYKLTMIFRTSGAIYPPTERNIQEDLNLQHHRRENLESRKIISNPLPPVFEICTFNAINSRASCL